MQKEIQAIRDLIASAKTKKALEKALALAKTIDDDDLTETFTLLLGRLSQAERQNNLGLSSSADYNRSISGINYGLLNSLDDFPADATDTIIEAVPSSSVSTPSTPPVIKPDGDVVFVPEDEVTQILFLASNPSDTGKLQLATEHSRVTSRLQESPEPEKFPLKLRQAVTPSEFTEYLFTIKPDIVHFSGHGDRQSPSIQDVLKTRAGRKSKVEVKNKEEESGIFLYDEDKRNSHFVSSTFLRRTFKSMVQSHKIPIKAVVFNACHSEEQAKAVSQVVPYVIGTSWSVRDDAAIAFATGFYFGVAQGMTIEQAVDHGINNALAYNEPEDRFLLYKDGKKVEW